jgi:DNA replication and repair protein RecF
MQEALERHRVIDSQRRTTSVGPQRADLEILIAGSEAKSVVSRGQQKLLAAGLILGQLESLARTRSLRPTLLLDDPAAELDAGAIGRFLSRVYQLGAQLVMTSLPGQVPGLPTQARMFHVKHGRVEPVL